MAQDQYRVDLSALDNVIKKLNGVLRDLGSANSDTRHKTYLPPNALGANAPGARFTEAENLTEAHKAMKTVIEKIVWHLNDTMNDFGSKTKKAHGAYQDQEADVTADMSGGA